MSKGIALVTGGTKGIGKALCLRLKDAGYQVFSASRSKSLPQGMDGITQVSVDFSNSLETRSFAEKFLEQYGIPKLLINNAGYGAFYEWADFPEEEINRQIQVLFSSPVELCRIFAPVMAEQGGGVIVNLSSLATLYPLPFMPLYNAGKAALSSFSQTLMLEYKHSPAIIDFRMGDVRTDFNLSASKPRDIQGSAKNAWAQIEKQLNKSIPVETAVYQILSRVEKELSGTFYGGTFFHRIILPFVQCFLLPSQIRRLIRFWYSLTDHRN
jgi:NAD(P)-dependent dehydrogenase (short-subunit alcohol dehydrogenase family)